MLFELKKSTLTRKSRAENVAWLLRDLSQSMLAAQAQLAQHELFLYKNDCLELRSENGDSYRLERRGRRVERIALTLLDFGALQNRDSLLQVMNTVVGSTVESSDPAEREAINKIQNVVERLTLLQRELAERRPIRGQPFHNCWFISLGQLLVMLDDVTSSETLKDALLAHRFISLGTLDFYYEYAKLKELRKLPTDGGNLPGPRT